MCEGMSEAMSERIVERAWRFVRACIVGAGATVVDFSVLTLCIRALDLAPVTARIPALMAGATVQFFGSRTFTFRAQSGRLSRQAKLFAVFELATLGLNWTTFRLLQPRLTVLPPEVVSFLGTFITFVVFAYPVRRLVIFRLPPQG
jgi:putative flippase GtrA